MITLFILCTTVAATMAATIKFPPTHRCFLINDTFGCLNATEKDLSKATQPFTVTVILTQSTIPILKKEFLKNFPVLVDFDCNGNEIETIEDDAFHNMGHLKYVGLSSNKLKNINPDIFHNCPNVCWFNVSENRNLVMPQNESFLNAPLLEVLDLQRCNLEKLYSVSFKNLTGLTFLSLAENNLTVLPNDVFKPLSNLRILDLSDNKMKTIRFQVFADIRPLFLFLAGNPWECDCELYPVIKWIESFVLKCEVTCVNPKNKKWRDVVLDCPEKTVEA